MSFFTENIGQKRVETNILGKVPMLFACINRKRTN